MNCLVELETLNKSVTYYNLRNLENPLSNLLIKQCLDFCVSFGLLCKFELTKDGHAQIHYVKTRLWPLLEEYVCD
jgi:hypothetical protein